MSSLPVLDAIPDMPDHRDWQYRPALTPLRAKIEATELDYWHQGRVRDQMQEPSCTGHALAALIDHLLAKRALNENAPETLPDGFKPNDGWAGAYMLYKNAQLQDEWEGEAYSGSSLRGVIKGFYHNGVCSQHVERELRREFDNHAAHRARPWYTNHELVSQSRQVQLGAYYRVQPRLTDMHAALNETGVVLASARVHTGWFADSLEEKVIPFGAEERTELSNKNSRPMRHAFVVLGYDDESFWIQNSWGTNWGDRGLARWRYVDWARNIVDAWVIQLAVPVPGKFRLSVGLKRVSSAPQSGAPEIAKEGPGGESGPTRLDVLGHMIPVEDGRIKRYGRYHHDLETLRSTFHIIAHRLTKEAQIDAGTPFAPQLKKTPVSDFWYRHVHIQFLGGWRSELSTASHVRKLQEVYKANRIYPLFFFWEPGTYSEVYRMLRGVIDEVNEQSDVGDETQSDLRERLIELKLAALGRRLRAEIRQASSRFFYYLRPDKKDPNIWHREPGEGIELFNSLLEELSWRFRNGSISYHLTAHGFGVLIVAQLLYAQDLLKRHTVFSSLNLIAPALDIQEFQRDIVPYLTARADGPVKRRARLSNHLIENVNLWHNSEEDDRVDRFDETYRWSWPELWSRVIGNIERNDAMEKGNAPRHLAHLKPSPELGEGFYRAKLLSLAEFVSEADTLAKAKGWPLNVDTIGRTNGNIRPGTHFGMDLSPRIVNDIIERISGGREKVIYKYTT